MEFTKELPALSASCLDGLKCAVKICQQSGNCEVRTEHFLLGLLERGDGRIVGWLRSRNVDAKTVSEDLQRRGALPRGFQFAWEGACEGVVLEKAVLSPGLLRVKDVLRQFCGGKVVDGLQVLQDGLVATEFLVAAMLLEGTNVACDCMIRTSQGRVNAKELLAELKVDPASVLLKPDTRTLEKISLGGGELDKTEWVHGEKLPEHVKSFPDPPTLDTNWVVPGHLLIGAGPTAKDFTQIRKKAKITTFVCLVGEYRSLSKLLEIGYPAAYHDGMGNIDLLFFPIEDFDVVPHEELSGLVSELKRRIHDGERVFIHCRGGHGRTGMVVIPLVAALYDIPLDDAQRFVQATHDASPRGRWGGHLPETSEQYQIAKKIWRKVTNKR